MIFGNDLIIKIFIIIVSKPIIAGIKIADNIISTIKGGSATDVNLLKANNAKTKSIRIKVVTLCI